MRTTRILAGLAATALAAGTLAAAPSLAVPAKPAKPAKPTVLAKGLLSPLSIAVDGTDVYVTQNFGGSLQLLRPGKQPKTLYTATKRGAEVGAVSARRGTVTFAVSESDKDGNYTATRLLRIAGSGKATPVANLLAYERKANPDGDVTYGVRGLADDCAAQWPADGPPASYPGIVDSHPYATTTVKRTTYVADAAMNAILAVSPQGKVRTVAVLPGVPTEITAGFAEEQGLPQCAVGLDYYFESVPTDVEVGPDGSLYVSSLPGGPEDPSMGARGQVFRVHPKSGKVSRVAGGLVSPVGVAVADNGDVYVSQLFSGAIAKIKKGSDRASTVRRLSMTGDVEVRGTMLFATTDVLPPKGKKPNGKVVSFRR
ncbi:ScyD/ScyE family protein [Nocardioides sp. LMS-CY]|uniref:ScyD/ScyE family protein n=1 Tax=Nocardioides sp. (strain LMS-CY) TaxID=2840457 RepID=UPI001C007E79|nr:ScyD/ScyE family protein [Nocardioides sp. LMS-CY]QWF21150.1 ScyD/ScyE family protein [Nocardioides sp. LMS-CY]